MNKVKEYLAPVEYMFCYTCGVHTEHMYINGVPYCMEEGDADEVKWKNEARIDRGMHDIITLDF
jgi:hypothetical protein